VFDHYFVQDLLIDPHSDGRCVGALALDPVSGRRRFFRANAVLLATGGCGHVYLHTTNPPIATGDGVAMAWRVGATIANMEFIQFHPTALYHPRGRSFLISEAVRGEGGILRTRGGDTFMSNYDPRAELAPRDIVARAIHAERVKRGEPCVFLDVTHLEADFLRHRFPTIYERCLELGIDITKHPIPVVPAAHYMCGGVATDLDGQTSIPGLFAAGEVACTGVHGANRLASNSLLEAMVFGRRAAEAAIRQAGVKRSLLEPPSTRPQEGSVPADQVERMRTQLQQTMNDYAGIVRTTRDLESALKTVETLRADSTRLVTESQADPELHELSNLATVAELILRCALARKESRGLHYTTDFPSGDDLCRHDTLVKNNAIASCQPDTEVRRPS
jgi:L-aspartate oxidase